jgi:DNA-binding CsgD family transcriptional regulator
MKDPLDIVTALTRRELEVLAQMWLNRGFSARELASILCLSEAGVRFHLRNIYRKLDVRGKIDLLFLCHESDFARVADRFRSGRDQVWVSSGQTPRAGS